MKLDFDSVNMVLEAYDAWRGRKKSTKKVDAEQVKLKADDGVEVLCAAIVFLVALLQGCVLTVFEKHIRKRFPEIDDEVKFERYRILVGANGNGANPNEQNVNRLFARIGIVDVMDGFTCGDTSQVDMAKLNDLSSIRNQIAHGTVRAEYHFGEVTYKINRVSVCAWINFVKRFAQAFEAHVEGKSV